MQESSYTARAEEFYSSWKELQGRPSEFSWDDKKLKTALASVLDMLHKSCVPPKAVKMDEEDNSCPLSAPAFSYCFPLIRAGLR